MVTISIIAAYISLKLVDQFIEEEGYGIIKKWFFPRKKYNNQLASIIEKVIEIHEKKYPYKNDEKKFPFYHSQILFEELNKHILFKTQYTDLELLLKFQENPNTFIPTKDELDHFYCLFVDTVNNDKQLKDLFFNENYKSKIFEINEVLIDLQKKIDIIFSDFAFQPDDNWFQRQCQLSIYDLGNRYTPDINFKLESLDIFEGLGRTQSFEKKVSNQFDELLIKGKKILRKSENIKEIIEEIETNLQDIFELYNSIDFCSNSKIPVTDFDKLLDNIYQDIGEIEGYYLKEEQKLRENGNKSTQYYYKYGYELENIRKFIYEINLLKELLFSPILQVANNPFLILDGDAGIGKSHMIGDVVSKRATLNYNSVFLLGQHFATEEDPWSQMFKRLQIKIQPDTFLSTLNQIGNKTNKRIIIFIDAINEGKGRFFWNKYIASFINEIKTYEWIGIVLTIRSSYKKIIFDNTKISDMDLTYFTLHGFKNVEYEASKLFFDNYKIELPRVPLLHPEFENPLFLKLFCEGISKSGLKKIPDGLQGMSAIINFYCNNINKVLSIPERFDYPEEINLIKKSINSIIQYKIDNNIKYVPFETAYSIIGATVSEFVSKKGFLNDLISEGIFSKNLFWKPNGDCEEGIYFIYERFEDHLCCQYLIQKYDDLQTEFKEGGNLYSFVVNERALYLNKGLIEAFSIQIPEKTGNELYEYLLPNISDSYPIVESFVNSLIWRKIDTLSERLLPYVNKCVTKYQETYNLFWETLISVSTVPNHYFNAKFLHNHLMRFSLSDRDSRWTIELKYKYSDDSAVKRLIDWAWDEKYIKSHISDEAIMLTSITLTWLLTSTNRQLRDSATKALICILHDRVEILIELLRLFEKVNDPYVFERLYAVAYGCAVRTKHTECLVELSEYIYNNIFKDKKEIYPHVLLRDYARNIIEFTAYQRLQLSFDIELVRPPYNSSLPETFPSDEEIERRYLFNYNSKDFKDYYWGQNSILSSMKVENGRGMYGDFGRYVFQSALRSWHINFNEYSNKAIEWIFEKYGYDVEKHGEFDKQIGSGRGRNTLPNERIGKKYQWIALYEMVARVSDNYKKYNSWSYNQEEDFQGPWDPYIRDIDPTILINKTGEQNEEAPNLFWWSRKVNFNWSLTNDEWINKSDDIIDFKDIIQVKDANDEEWFVVESFPEWAEPKRIGEKKWDYPHKRFWLQTRSYLVKEEDCEKLYNWAVNKDFMGRWMPESSDRYEIYSREYYWSPAHKYLMADHEENQWQDIYDKESGQNIVSVIVTTESFRWEEEFDYSKESTISILKPCSFIYEGMDLKYSKKEGEFLNSNDDTICFAANVYHNTEQSLLIRKKPFIKFLETNGLRIIWTVLGEKQIIGGKISDEEYLGSLEISGAYYYNCDILEGEISIK